MAFQMAFNKEELSGAVPVPSGWYIVQIKNFKPRAAKPKAPSTVSESVSLNAELTIVSDTSGSTEYEGRRVSAGLNTKMAWMWTDFVHATGLEMEIAQDEFTGTEKERKTLPGIFEGADTDSDPSTWKYLGPLLNKTMEVELCEREYNGKKSNDIRQYKCAVPGCTEQHATNLIKN